MSTKKVITGAEWTAIDSELSHPWGCVELLCDGFRVNLHVERTAKLKYGIVTYVNGEWRGEWVKGEAEQAKRFLRPVATFVHRPKERSAMIKIYGGKRCKKADLERINMKITFWHVEWTSVKAMRQHFQKNNSSLELVRIGPAPVALVEKDKESV